MLLFPSLPSSVAEKWQVMPEGRPSRRGLHFCAPLNHSRGLPEVDYSFISEKRDSGASQFSGGGDW